jgi:hypothetical protein
MRDNFKRITTLIILIILTSCGKDDDTQSLQFDPGDEVVLINDIGFETYDSGCKVPVCISSDILDDFYWAVRDENGNCQRAFENLPNVGVKNLPLLHLGFIILLFLPLRACL